MSKDAVNSTYLKTEQTVAVKWTAPEAIDKGLFSHKSDVWSFGITLWELFSDGSLPYSTMSNIQTTEEVLKGYRLPQPDKCSDPFYKILQRCWNVNPDERPTFKVCIYLLSLTFE